MTLEIFLVLLITLSSMVLFISEKLRVDAIAILVLDVIFIPIFWPF